MQGVALDCGHFFARGKSERTAAELIRFYRNALSNKLLQPTRNDGASYL